MVEDLKALYKQLKHSTASVIHYTITTCMGVKRYLSCLLCVEPSQELDKELGDQVAVLRPFVYCLVQSTPAFEFSRDLLLEGIHRRVLLPDYKTFCNQPRHDAYYYSINLECFLTYLFGIVNTRELEQVHAPGSFLTSITGLNRRGRLITHENQNSEYSELFYPAGNISYKTFLRVAFQSPEIIVQIVNWILLERKLLIVSPASNQHHMRRNALFIESLFSLLTPFLSALPIVYLNIAFLSLDQVLNFMDSPVPFVIGMSIDTWNKGAKAKFEKLSQED